MNTHRCCDNCNYYNWYYNRCNKYDCETDERSVCASFAENEKLNNDLLTYDEIKEVNG